MRGAVRHHVAGRRLILENSAAMTRHSLGATGMSIKKVDVMIFVALCSFIFINSFFIHRVSFVDSVAFFLVCTSSAAVIFLYRQKGATLLKLFFLFSFLFFGFVPPLELYYGEVYWGGRPFSAGDYGYAALLVLFFNVVVFVSYLLTSRSGYLSSETDARLPEQDRVRLEFIQVLLLVGVSAMACLLILYMNDFNVYSLVFRGGELVQRKSLDSVSSSLLYGFFIRFIPISTAIVMLFMVRGMWPIKALLLVIGVVSAFPTGLARLSVPTYYFPLLFFFFPRLLKNNRVPLLVSLGIVFVFPFLEGFRRYSSESGLSYSLDYKFLLAGHFDAFQNFTRIITDDFVSYGYQLLGVLFFYVPRSFWSSKPVGTGHALAEQENYNLANISATWYAEGWANFGFLGALLFSVLIGVVMAKLDRKYWLGHSRPFFRIMYLVLLGYVFFLLRGDLMSGMAFLIGTMMAIAVPYLIISRVRLHRFL
ncbi:hypothetical protein [Modicisalibacter coralii]|uniref:hypothetical protein n=1 Tax=Modicisalibacter coralii TaxID=2304602 RepID=UPI00100B873B|nr:hypothetical protein [Halomonas coralii]